MIASADFPFSMRTDTWRDLRKTAARLLPDNLRQALNDYYSPLQTLLTLLQFENRVNDRADRLLREAIKEKALQKEWHSHAIPTMSIGTVRSRPKRRRRSESRNT